MTHRTTVLMTPLWASDPWSPLLIPHPLPHLVFCKLSHCSSALLRSQRYSISLPLLQPPNNHVGVPTSRTLHLASAGSAFLPERIVEGSSHHWALSSNASLLAGSFKCTVWPAPPTVKLFAYLFTCLLSAPSPYCKLHQGRDFVSLVLSPISKGFKQQLWLFVEWKK